MRKVFSSNEISETVLVRDALIQHGVGADLLNEYSSQSAIPAFRPPAEIWVRNDDDYDSARRIVIDTLSKLDNKSDARPWVCSSCGEENPASFEMCWSCARDKAAA